MGCVGDGGAIGFSERELGVGAAFDGAAFFVDVVVVTTALCRPVVPEGGSSVN